MTGKPDTADIGLALYLAHRFDEAEQVLQRILRQDPKMTVAHRHSRGIQNHVGSSLRYGGGQKAFAPMQVNLLGIRDIDFKLALPWCATGTRSA